MNRRRRSIDLLELSNNWMRRQGLPIQTAILLFSLAALPWTSGYKPVTARSCNVVGKFFDGQTTRMAGKQTLEGCQKDADVAG